MMEWSSSAPEHWWDWAELERHVLDTQVGGSQWVAAELGTRTTSPLPALFPRQIQQQTE